MRIAQVILSGLVNNEEYLRRVIPHLKAEYFTNPVERIILEAIQEHVARYNSVPTRQSLSVDLSERSSYINHEDKKVGVSDDMQAEIQRAVRDLSDERVDVNWLTDESETFCKDQSMYLAIRQSMKIYSGEDKELDKAAIPEIVTKALAVSFTTSLGINYVEDTDTRFDYYTQKKHKLPFDIYYLNKITRGGVQRKTLNVLAAGTGVGKTAILCNLASSYILQGLNVLYISLELSKDEATKRIDENILDLTQDELERLSRPEWDRKIEGMRKRVLGNCIIVEFSQAGVPHFRHLLNELKLKQGFIPDVVMLDYINLSTSGRLKHGSNVNTYTYVKSVTEEFRALAVERNFAGWTATQFNRGGYADSDAGIEHTSDSFGIPMTADLMLLLITSEELEGLNQILFKQTSKNRYGDSTKNRRFVVGFDRPKQRLYDVEESAQDVTGGPTEDRPVFDGTESGERVSAETVDTFSSMF